MPAIRHQARHAYRQQYTLPAAVQHPPQKLLPLQNHQHPNNHNYNQPTRKALLISSLCPQLGIVASDASYLIDLQDQAEELTVKFLLAYQTWTRVVAQDSKELQERTEYIIALVNCARRIQLLWYYVDVQIRVKWVEGWMVMVGLGQWIHGLNAFVPKPEIPLVKAVVELERNWNWESRTMDESVQSEEGEVL